MYDDQFAVGVAVADRRAEAAPAWIKKRAAWAVTPRRRAP
jgi:hypothetical protein